MSNSNLVVYKKLSPNYSIGRKHKIDRITPHYMGGNCSIETCGEIFAPKARQASSNYGIDSNGRIGLYVEECNRAWTSGSSYNDNRAVTIECANYADGSLSDACWSSLVLLCVDICKRNVIAKLNYTGEDSGNITMHKWYQDTDCPGPWLSKQFARLASEVNTVLNGGKLPDKNDIKHFGGRYECMVPDLNVRTRPSLSGVIVAQYHYGEIVVLDDWYENKEGYVWGCYIGQSSGQQRYVAIGRATGRVENDDYLIKIG